MMHELDHDEIRIESGATSIRDLLDKYNAKHDNLKYTYINDLVIIGEVYDDGALVNSSYCSVLYVDLFKGVLCYSVQKSIANKFIPVYLDWWPDYYDSSRIAEGNYYFNTFDFLTITLINIEKDRFINNTEVKKLRMLGELKDFEFRGVSYD